MTTYDYVSTLFDNDNNPNKVTVALTMANKALERGHSVALILMVDAVHLACPGRIDGIDIGDPFKPAKALQEAFLDKGGRIYVCQSCMVHNGITQEMLDSRFELITADGVIQLLMSATGTLQLS